MLQYLKIKNLALLTEITLEFDIGFTALTGETGAGKSILLEALSLLAGCRADKSIIRQGASSCEIEAILFFSNPSRINAALESLNLPLCEENTLILKRSIEREKSPRIQINGSLSSLSSLQILGEFWIDFHRPSEPQKLLQHQYQLQILDLYGGLMPLLKEYSDLYFKWKNLLKTVQELSDKERLSQDEIDFYQSQINKITAINPTEESIRELEENFARIANSQEINLLSAQLESGLQGDSGITASIQTLLKPAYQLSKLLPTTNSLSQRLDSLIIETEDLASEYAAINHSIDNDPESIHETQTNMHDWLEIKRQYGPTLEIVLKKLQSLQEKVSSQAHIETTLHTLQKDADILQSKLEKIAITLRQKRQESAKTLAPKVQKLFHSLGLQNAKLDIKIHPESTLKEYGNCFAQFLFASNKGQSYLPLHKIASSGETARVMLSFKTILAEVDQTPLLVFDEIDANIGGEIASKVAHELRALSTNHQVLCVTHLPQTAAQAHNHYTVTKVSSSNNTSITIHKLSDSEQRIRELARMFGDRSSESALTHARDLLALQSLELVQ